MAAAAVQQAPQWPTLQKQLEKKTSFEAAVSDCISALQAPQLSSLQELRKLLARCLTLLKSRYKNPAFWSKGRQLFQAAHAAVADEAFREEICSYIQQCDEFLGDEASQSGQQALTSTPPIPQSYLFEGQMLSVPAPPAEDLLVSLPRDLMQQFLQRAEGEGEHTATQLPQELALEQLQQELDAIAQRIMDETGQQAAPASAPPASKKAVSSLPRETLSLGRLEELGGTPLTCPVCMEELREGDEVQVMPCRHVFHPPCLAPWLQQHNSCPTCRHELPTDDQQYERRKERERVEAEERRARENALSHNEFLYI